MSSAILDKLFSAMQRSKGLPALEDTVSSVLGSLSDFRKGHRDVVHHIVEDAALTHKVLKLANSAMYAPFARSADSVLAAVSILGSDAVLHLVLGTAVVTAAELEDEESLARVLFSAELARCVYAERSEDVSIAALMYDLGSLMAATHLPQEMAAIQRQLASGQSFELAQQEVLGMSLQDLGAAVAQRWRLPAPIVSIIDGSGDPTLVGVARFSSVTSALVYDGKLDEAHALVAQLDLPGTDTSKVTELITSQFDELRDTREPLADTSAEHLLEALFQSLSRNRKKTVEELAGAIFATFAQTLHAAHCLLFMRTTTGGYNIRCGHGPDVEQLMQRLKISADFKPTAFHAAIKNHVDVSITDVSKLRPTALIDDYTQLLPEVNKFLILPIGNHRVGGLVYCDWDTSKVLSPEELDAAKKLRTLFSPFFPG